MHICGLRCQFDRGQAEIDKFLESQGSRFRAKSQDNFELLEVQTGSVIVRLFLFNR
jgi:hypothetical protein